MADVKLKQVIDGVPTLKTPITVSAGATSENEVPGLNSSGKFDKSFMPPEALSEESFSRNAGEDISAPALVCLVGGSVMKADSSVAGAARAAIGYINTSVTNGNSVQVFFGGVSSGWTGLTADKPMYLATAGGVSDSPDMTSGHTYQNIGKSVSATEILFERDSASVVA